MGHADRSPAAAEVCRELAKENRIGIEVRYAGLEATVGKVTKEKADAATRIFVMEEYMRNALIKDYSQLNEKIECLDVKDHYDTRYPQEKKN